jgi:hypothetical protein
MVKTIAYFCVLKTDSGETLSTLAHVGYTSVHLLTVGVKGESGQAILHTQ